MKLGMICYEFDRASFERIRDLGLDSIEFCVNVDVVNRWKEFSDRADDIAKNLSELGLVASSVGRWGGNKLLEDGSANPDELKADEALIEAASRISCPVYCTGCNYIESLSLYENYTAAIRYLEKLLEFGKKYGVKIAVYNCRWNNFIHSDPAWSIVHGHLQDLYIKFDPSHSIYAKGENYLSEMKKWGKRIAHVHIKGSMLIDGERFDDPPAGLDQTNWGAFMEMLYAAGYDGSLSIEPHSDIWRSGDLGEAGLRYTIQYIRKLMF